MPILPLLVVLAQPAEAPAGKLRTDRTVSLEVTLDAPPAEVYRLSTTCRTRRSLHRTGLEDTAA